MKVALVYDRVNKVGGAERVLTALHQLFPRAPLYTSVYQSSSASWAQSFQVKPSFIQKIPFAKKNHELFPWLTTLAFESFDMSDYDLVISITSAEAKAVITSPQTLHLCYCLTPTRYLWSHLKDYSNSPGLGGWSNLARRALNLLKPSLQSRDLISASRPDTYLAISHSVQKRIKKFYHRNSLILYPPVDYQHFSTPSLAKIDLPFKKYFLIASRLTSYKKIDLAIKTFNQLKLNLVIVGTGRDQSRLKAMSGSTIKFLGSISDDQLAWVYQHATALIMPQEEDFGIVSLEAQSAGKPVIALKAGGALDTVIESETGLFFSKPTVDSLAKAVKRFALSSWDHKLIKSQAKKFDTKVFKTKFKQIMEDQWQKHHQ